MPSAIVFRFKFEPLVQYQTAIFDATDGNAASSGLLTRSIPKNCPALL